MTEAPNWRLDRLGETLVEEACSDYVIRFVNPALKEKEDSLRAKLSLIADRRADLAEDALLGHRMEAEEMAKEYGALVQYHLNVMIPQSDLDGYESLADSIADLLTQYEDVHDPAVAEEIRHCAAWHVAYWVEGTFNNMCDVEGNDKERDPAFEQMFTDFVDYVDGCLMADIPPHRLVYAEEEIA